MNEPEPETSDCLYLLFTPALITEVIKKLFHLNSFRLWRSSKKYHLALIAKMPDKWTLHITNLSCLQPLHSTINMSAAWHWAHGVSNRITKKLLEVSHVKLHLNAEGNIALQKMCGLISWIQKLIEEKCFCLSVLLVNSSFIAMFEFYSDTKFKCK